MKKHLLINIMSIVFYAFLFLSWNALESFNPPLKSRKIQLLNNSFIDLFGAIIPIVLSSTFLYYLTTKNIIKLRKFIKYSFILTLLIYLLLTTYDGSVITIKWLNVILLSSFISTIIVIKNHNIKEKPVSYFRSINIFLLSYSFSTSSTLLIDLLFAIFSTESYIGAAGIVDAIFLSSIFVFIPTFFWLSLINILKININSSFFKFILS